MRIAIIPARGGSVRIPRKNARNFFGVPVIAYSINAALESGLFDDVMVSTEDSEIAAIARAFGASTPFPRPESLSAHDTPTISVLEHVLDEYSNLGKNFSQLCCIYPCAPLIVAERLREGMAALANWVDCVVPVLRYPHPPQRCLEIDKSGMLHMKYPENRHISSQKLAPLYHDAGQFYCLQTSGLNRAIFGGRVIPIVLPTCEAQDIDTEEDWQMAMLKYRARIERN